MFDVDCQTLAALHSDAVDYQKSGQPVSISKIPQLKFTAKPDWNAPEVVSRDNVDFYESQHAIGKLFRAFDLPDLTASRRSSRSQRRRFEDDFNTSFAQLGLQDRNNPLFLAVQDHVVRYIDVEHVEREEQEVVQIFNRYASDLDNICANHTLSYSRSSFMLTEEEAIIGTISAKSSQPRLRKDLMSKLREQTEHLSHGIREELAGDENLPLTHWLRRAWGGLKVSVGRHDKFGAKSFGWVCLGVIFDAIR